MNRLLARVPTIVLWGAGLLAVGAFVALAPVRMLSPLEFGFGDGMMLDHVLRVVHGQPLYVAPTLQFIPLAYMPLYVYVVAPLVALFGPHFWTGRLVSLLASLGLAFLTARILRHETGRWSLGIAGAGLCLMGQGFSRGSYDTFRPDPLMLLLAFSGLATLRFTRGRAGAVGAALLLAAAFFTKQHALCFGAAAFLHLAVSDRARLPAFAIAWVAACAGGFLLLSATLGPWFSFYVYDVPSHWSEFSRARIQSYLGRDLLGRLGGLSIPVLLSLALPERPWRGPAGLWWWVGLGGVGTGLLATLDPWAYFHVLMPTLTAFAVLGPLALSRIADRLGAPADAGRAGLGAVAAVVVIQFVALAYPVRSLLPAPHARATYEAFEARLRGIPGRVIVPTHGFFAWSVGKGSSLHTLPLDDILRSRGNRLLARDPLYFERMFETLRRGPGRPILLCDAELDRVGDESRPLWATLAGSYRLVGRFGDLAGSLAPRIGYRGAPVMVFAPVEPATPAVPAPASPVP